MIRFVPKTVLITGTSRGIGRALAERYVNTGATVFAVSRAMNGAEPPAGPGTLIPIAADVTDLRECARIAEIVAQAGAPLDLLVNNAGIQQAIDLSTIASDDLIDRAETEIAINLVAPMILTQMLQPFIRRPGGTIVNITSLIARQPKPSAPVYSASKAGLASYTAALRHQLAPTGIVVIEVLPPLVDTDMTTGRGSGKLSAGDTADAIIEGVARRRQRVAPGKAGTVLALNRLAPELVRRIVAKA